MIRTLRLAAGARLGRRGSMLMVLACTYVLIGVGVLIRPVAPSQGSFVLLVPQEVLCGAWVSTGLVAALFAWSRARNDVLGWLALYVVPGVYFCSYSGAWVLWVMTTYVFSVEPPYGDPVAWYNAVLRVPFIAIVLICSGWRERSPNL